MVSVMHGWALQPVFQPSGIAELNVVMAKSAGNAKQEREEANIKQSGLRYTAPNQPGKNARGKAETKC